MGQIIQLESIKKTYFDKKQQMHALSDVSLSVNRGEMIAVMGASGAGKTTLLNIIGGIDSLYEGYYRYEDTVVSGMKTEERKLFRRKHVSFIFQGYALMERFSVFENVELPLLIRKISKENRSEFTWDALKKVGLDELAHRRPSKLSGGEKQRCAIARAIVSDADLILADEPTGSLDDENAVKIMNLLDQLHQNGKTILLVTHDNAIASQCDRVIVLKSGKAVES